MNSTQFEEGFGGMAVRFRGLDRLLQTNDSKRAFKKDVDNGLNVGLVVGTSRIEGMDSFVEEFFCGKNTPSNFPEEYLSLSLTFKDYNFFQT